MRSKVRQIRPDDAEVNELVAEQIRLCYVRMGHNIRELEAYKLKRGICVMGISCTRKAVEGALGGKRGCAHHHAAAKAGIKLAKWTHYDSEYGKLRKEQKEREREEKRLEAEREKENKQRLRRVAGG